MNDFRYLKLASQITVLLIIGGLIGWWLSPRGTEPSPLRPLIKAAALAACETEDSDNCYWDAQTRGNRVGNDSVVITTPWPDDQWTTVTCGEVTYLFPDHEYADEACQPHDNGTVMVDHDPYAIRIKGPGAIPCTSLSGDARTICEGETR